MTPMEFPSFSHIHNDRAINNHPTDVRHRHHKTMSSVVTTYERLKSDLEVADFNRTHTGPGHLSATLLTLMIPSCPWRQLFQW
jgi:hypothetical protein